MLDTKKEQLLALGIAVVIIIAGVALLIQLHTISNTGRIRGFGCDVFADPAATEPLDSIAWGDIDPGGYKTHIIYVKNIREIPMTFTFNTTNWIPAIAEDYLNLTWDYAGQVLASEQVTSITLTLTVAQEVQQTDVQFFSFDISVWATQYKETS